MTGINVPEGTIPASVALVGGDGNAFAIIGRVSRGLKKAGNPPEVVDAFEAQAMAGDYDHLLRVALAFTDA